MSKASKFGTHVFFWCPGCDGAHSISTESWTWNGSLESPTFAPSLLTYRTPKHPQCHSFVTDGRIQFLADSEHDLAGQTVDLPDCTTDGDPS